MLICLTFVCGVNEQKHGQSLFAIATHMVVKGGIVSVQFTVMGATPLCGLACH